MGKLQASCEGFGLGCGTPTYINAIGVPRRVSDEDTLVDQVAAGSELFKGYF